MNRIRAILDANGGVQHRRDDDFSGRCPCHNDRVASLSVTWVDDPIRGGKTLLNCHGCSATAADICEALGLTLADLFDEPPQRLSAASVRAGRSPQQRRNGRRRTSGRLPDLVPVGEPQPEIEHVWREVLRYVYKDLSGRVVQEVVREHCDTAKCSSCRLDEKTKRFKQVFRNEQGTYVKRRPPGFVPVLYRAPELAARLEHAIATGKPVWLFEGEKDADTGVDLDLQLSTTNAQGAGNFPSSCAEMLVGARIFAVLDRDDAGFARGVELHDLFFPIAAEIVLLMPATTARKSDFTDHVDAGLWQSEDEFGGLVQVSVAEAAAHASLSKVRAKLQLVEGARQQADARAQRADDATTEARRNAEGGYARSWAMEAERRFEKVCDAVEEVNRLAVTAATTFAAEAADEADVLLNEARSIARAAHEIAHLPVPQPLHAPVVPDNEPAPASEDDSAPTATVTAMPGTAAPEGEAPVGRERVAVTAPDYRIVDDRLVEMMRNRDGDEYLKLILSLDARIVEMEFLERDDPEGDAGRAMLPGRDRSAQLEANPVGPETLSAVIIGFTHPDTREWMRMRISAEEYRDGSWVESLPGPPEYDSRPSGMSRMRDALKSAGATDGITRTVRYRATGWRQDDNGEFFYIHAGGAIHADGVRPASILMTSPLTRYDLPLPSKDPASIRQAFLQHSGSMLTKLPTRVAAPLLGQVFRSVLGPCQWTLLLVGPPGTFKTSVASTAMNHFGELWDRSHPGASMSGNGDTFNALRLKTYSVKDACFFADDVAPTSGWTAAQQALEMFARMIYNGEARSRVTRDGQSVLEGTPPRASAIVTSEVTPRPGSSGGQRTFPVPMVAGDIDLEVLKDLSRDESRHGRALLMSSFLQWLAPRLPEMRTLAREEAEQLAAELLRGGGEVRNSDAVGVVWSGWVVMARFLEDIGALSADEASRLLNLVIVGLTDAAAASGDPDNPARTGARVRELIEHALRSGIAHVEDIRTGEAPMWPLAARLGWKRSLTGQQDGPLPKYREDPRGIRLGYVALDEGREPELIVTKAALEQVLKETAGKLTDAPTVDLPTAVRALHSEGVLLAETRGFNKPPRFTVKRTLHCEGGRVERMTVLKLWEVIGGPGGPGDLEPIDPDNGTDPDDDGGSGPQSLEDWICDDAFPATDGADQAVKEDAGDRGAAEDESACQTADLESESAAAPAVGGVHGDSSASSSEMDEQMRAHPVCEGQFELPLDPTETAVTSDDDTSPATGGEAEAVVVDEAPAPVVAPAAAPVAQPATTREAVTSANDTSPARRPAAAAKSRRPSSRFTAAVAIADVDGVWLPDGSCVPLPQVTHVGDLAALAAELKLGTQVNARWEEPGQIWVTEALLAQVGVAVPESETKDQSKLREVLELATTNHPFVTEAIAAGWKIGGQGDRLRTWTRVWKTTDDAAAPWIVLLAGMSRDSFDVPVLDEETTPAQLARRLQLFADALKWPFRINAQTTGFELMFNTRWKQRREQGWFQPAATTPPSRISTLEAEFSWSRTLTSDESARRFVHCYDRGGSHLAAYAGLSLPIGDPEYWEDGREFDPTLPGYWRVEITASGDWRLPHPLLRQGEAPGQLWVTTPALDYARQLGHEPEVIRAYTWANRAKALVPYYEACRDARTELDTSDVDAQLARDLLKTVYTRTGGMMGSANIMAIPAELRPAGGQEFREGFKPEWRHHWIAKACMNELRQVVKIGHDTGEYPVAMTDDTVVYVSDNPDPVAAWPGEATKYGRGLGQYKWEGSALLADHAQFLTGKRYTNRQKDELTKDWDPVHGGYTDTDERGE